jgi:hypothetical protein
MTGYGSAAPFASKFSPPDVRQALTYLTAEYVLGLLPRTLLAVLPGPTVSPSHRSAFFKRQWFEREG